MQGERQPGSSLEERLDNLKKDFFSYIEKNSPKVDANLPVFFGYVIASLDPFAPEISDDMYDEFFDEITLKVLDESKNASDLAFIEKVCANAIRAKKRSDARTGIDIAAGIKLMKLQDYTHAVPYLRNYAERDAIIGTAVAYCYYMLSLREIADRHHSPAQRSDAELLAREQVLAVARKGIPIGTLSGFAQRDEEWLTRAFWLMISSGIEWFPNEKGLIKLGLGKAARDGNKEMRLELLKIAIERFFDDMDFLRESYYLRLEERDAIGAAGIVKQMLQQYPDALEPIYFGIKLSLLTTVRTTYDSFRKLAVAKGMPTHILQLLDLAFSLMVKDAPGANTILRDLKQRANSYQYYAITLEYLAHDVFGADEKRARRAKKAVLDSLDAFCIQTLRDVNTEV
ncbi:MAG: hypothetical protein LUQ40_06475 [Methanomicrobiales archaeon]|nr:hypothetical protein [Methanomicrobiales archaeon]